MEISYPNGVWDGMGDDPRIMFDHHIDKYYFMLFHEHGIRRPIPQEMLDEPFDVVITQS